jgi:hypothetical protein
MYLASRLQPRQTPQVTGRSPALLQRRTDNPRGAEPISFYLMGVQRQGTVSRYS